MKYQLQVFVFALIVLGVAAKRWGAPQKLEAISNSSFGLNLFMPQEGQSFVLYNRPDFDNNQELGIRSYDFNTSTLGNFTKISNNRLFFTADIQGSGEGEQVLVAFSGSRAKLDEVPMENSSFYDIFLTRSSKPNIVWTEEAAIDKGSNNTQASRINPKIIAVDETGQMHVFYINLREDNITTLVTAKFQPEEANLVDKEQIIATVNSSRFSYSVAYTYVNESLILHAVYSGNNSELMYTSSKSGNKWTAPIPLDDLDPESHVVSLVSNTKIEPTMLLLAYTGKDNKTHARVSNNHGELWKKPIEIYKKKALRQSLAVCGDDNERVAFLLLSTNDKLKLRKVELEGDEEYDIDSVKAPFQKMNITGAVIKCNKRGGKYELMALGTEETHTVAYVSTLSYKD